METILESCFFGFLLFPPIVFIYVVWRLQGLSAARRAFAGGFFACAVFATLMILAVSIFITDVGFGPDAVEVHGIDALANCWDGVVLAVPVGVIFAAFGIVLATYKDKNARQSGLMRLIWLCLIVGGTWVIFQARADFIFKSLLRPNVFSTADPKWLFDSGYRFDFDAREGMVISNWISAQQAGWEFGSLEDFNLKKPEFCSDNYSIQIDQNKIVIGYYKSEGDLTNDPSDSFIVIKRPIAAGELAFWATQVNQVKTAEKGKVKLP